MAGRATGVILGASVGNTANRRLTNKVTKMTTTISNTPDFSTLPQDGDQYYWACALRYWAHAGAGGVSTTQYWTDGQGRVWQDEPVIVDNTYRGERRNQRQIRM